MKIRDKYIEHYTICKKNISNPLLAEKYIGKPVVGYILREEEETFGLESKYNVQRIIQGTLTHINKESGKPFIVTDNNFPYTCNYIRLVEMPHYKAEKVLEYMSNIDNSELSLDKITWQEILDTLLTKSRSFLQKTIKE